MARGLIECSQAADARAELGYNAEAVEYLRSAYRQLFDAMALVRSTMRDMELAQED
jgi:hypothetical protein